MKTRKLVSKSGNQVTIFQPENEEDTLYLIKLEQQGKLDSKLSFGDKRKGPPAPRTSSWMDKNCRFAMTQIGPATGTNPGGRYRDDEGQEWYVKTPSDPKRLDDEYLASKLYQMTGIRVPETKRLDLEGRPGIASKMIGGLKNIDHRSFGRGKLPKGIAEGAIIDAWLGNYDVVGGEFDNLMLTPEGEAVRLDPGGALRYRAQGKPKKHHSEETGDYPTWSEEAHDLNRILFQEDAKYWPEANAAQVFQHATAEDLEKAFGLLEAIKDEDVRNAVFEHWGGSPEEKEKMVSTLLARKNWILSRKEEVLERKRG